MHIVILMFTDVTVICHRNLLCFNKYLTKEHRDTGQCIGQWDKDHHSLPPTKAEKDCLSVTFKGHGGKKPRKEKDQRAGGRRNLAGF